MPGGGTRPMLQGILPPKPASTSKLGSNAMAMRPLYWNSPGANLSPPLISSHSASHCPHPSWLWYRPSFSFLSSDPRFKVSSSNTSIKMMPKAWCWPLFKPAKVNWDFDFQWQRNVLYRWRFSKMCRNLWQSNSHDMQRSHLSGLTPSIVSDVWIRCSKIQFNLFLILTCLSWDVRVYVLGTRIGLWDTACKKLRDRLRTRHREPCKLLSRNFWSSKVQ